MLLYIKVYIFRLVIIINNMIGRLRGKFWDSDLESRQIILDIQGVGYLINVSLLVFEKVISEYQIDPEYLFDIYIQTIVREDSFELYGFLDLTEKKVFNLLTSVSGIGPKIALYIFSKISTGNLIDLILSENINRLIALPGIGKKTANRLLLELRERFQKNFSDLNYKKNLDSNSNLNSSASSYSRVQETVSGLMRLGFSAEQAHQKIQIVLKSPENPLAHTWKTPELLRAVLKELA
jgi:Holliday junction DNA helicase RuvA